MIGFTTELTIWTTSFQDTPQLEEGKGLEDQVCPPTVENLS